MLEKSWPTYLEAASGGWAAQAQALSNATSHPDQNFLYGFLLIQGVLFEGNVEEVMRVDLEFTSVAKYLLQFKHAVMPWSRAFYNPQRPSLYPFLEASAVFLRNV